MNPAITAVIQAEERLAQAHVDMDLAAIADLLHPDYVILQPDGQTETRQAVLDSYRSGDRAEVLLMTSISFRAQAALRP